MNTVLRVGGLRFMIFVDDHAPAHVHAIGDGVAKINLVGTDGSPWIVWSKGMTLAEQRWPPSATRRPNYWISGNGSMVEPTDEDLQAAAERGRMLWETEPRAQSARYDRKSPRIVVELTNGSTFAFPARLAQGLEQATDDELAAVEVLGEGYGLHWEKLDADFTVPGLLAGIFGTKRYMAQLAGRSTSAAKATAARVNGAKGGRPRKAV